MSTYIFSYFFETQSIAQRGYASAVAVIATLIVGLITGIYLFGSRKMFSDD
jgi:ABC-type sugar transport system permease subunit